MEIYMTTGARCFPAFGPLAAPGGISFKRLRIASFGARRLRAGSPFHWVLINLTGSDVPVTDRMRTSASEP